MKDERNVAKIPTSIKLMTNNFVCRLFDLYDKAYNPDEDDFEYVSESYCNEKPLWRHWFVKSEKEKINKGLEIAYQNAMKTLLVNPNNLDIETIENFCDFVRVAEKIAFYQNDSSKEILVDSQVKDNNKKLIISNEDYTIAIRTSLGPYSHNENGNNTLHITVERSYGKKMHNEFIVVNREVQYNDDSDMYLINTINLVLMNIINKTLKEVYDTIKEKKIKGTQ